MLFFMVNSEKTDLSILQHFAGAGFGSLIDINLPAAALGNESFLMEAAQSNPLIPATIKAYGNNRHKLTLLNEAKEYIDSHYTDVSCTLSLIAKNIHVSPGYLSSIFKETMGTKFINYLTDQRIRKAGELLLQTDMMIYEVSTRVGYENPTYFSTIFRKSTGMSPQEYRSCIAAG